MPKRVPGTAPGRRADRAPPAARSFERRVKDGIAEAGLARVAGAIGPMVERLAARQVDPYTAADDLVKLALLASSEGSATIAV